MPKELISVIIPVHNRPEGAARALASALAHDDLGERRLEAILVDDASDPLLTLDQDDARVRIVRLDKNAGPAAARNAGIEAAQGDIIAFLDSDDLWLPGKLAAQLALYDRLANAENPDRLILTCAFYYPERHSQVPQLRRPISAQTVEQFAAGCWYSPGSTQLAHRTVYDRAGLLDARLRRLEDYEWSLRFARMGGRLAVAPEPGAVIAPSYAARFEQVDYAARAIFERFGPCGEFALGTRAQDAAMAAYLALESSASALGNGRRLEALLHFGRSLHHRPRLRRQVLRFWEVHHEVPDEVRALLREMSEGDRLSGL